ncbi:hypothetical protein ABZ897_55955 [Nonomuraea sp. NPDC046802]|uniref:hypothetical protein n=1 Tax=Nonomuraea sp. NPDC046802 TaxID=3154919 RepID=UPI0033D7BA57
MIRLVAFRAVFRRSESPVVEKRVAGPAAWVSKGSDGLRWLAALAELRCWSGTLARQSSA